MAHRRYETLVVMHPDLGDPGAKELATKIRGIIEAQGGEILQVLEWGQRELAYLIEKQRRGIYVLFEFRASAAGLSEMERQLRIMDPILRHISVRQDDDAPLATAPRTSRYADADDAPAERAPERDEPAEQEGV
jgi:small subunit ribosomal protein S6